MRRARAALCALLIPAAVPAGAATAALCARLDDTILSQVETGPVSVIANGCRIDGLLTEVEGEIHRFDRIDVTGDLAALLPVDGAARRLPTDLRLVVAGGRLPQVFSEGAERLGITELSLRQTAPDEIRLSGLQRLISGETLLDWSARLTGLPDDLSTPRAFLSLHLREASVTARFDGGFEMSAPLVRFGNVSARIGWSGWRNLVEQEVAPYRTPVISGQFDQLLRFIDALPRPDGTLRLSLGGAGVTALQLALLQNADADPALLGRIAESAALTIDWDPAAP